MEDPREVASEEIRYGSEQLTVPELRDHFAVSFNGTEGITYILTANTKLAKLHHTATFETVRAAELLSAAKRVWNEESDRANDNLTELEKEKISKNRMTVDQRKSKINKQLAPLLAELNRAQDEVDQWNRILEHLKYVAKRVDTSTVVESVEAKLLKSQ